MPDLDTAIRLYQRGAFDAAAQACRELLAREEDNVRALNLLGVLMTQAGQLADAEACYRRAVEADPKFFDGWQALGMALMKKGELKEAIGAALMATELEPNDLLAWTGLSQMYMKNGQIREAEMAKSNAAVLGLGGKVKK